MIKLPVVSRNSYNKIMLENTELLATINWQDEEIKKIKKENEDERFNWLKEKSALTDKAVVENKKLKEENLILKTANTQLFRENKKYKDKNYEYLKKLRGIGGYVAHNHRLEKEIKELKEQLSDYQNKDLENLGKEIYSVKKVKSCTGGKQKMSLKPSQKYGVKKQLKEIGELHERNK